MKCVHVAMASFFIGLGAVVWLGVQQAICEALSEIRSSMIVTAFLAPTLTDADATKLEKSLQEADPAIRTLTYTSREVAYQQAMKDPALSRSLMVLKQNPLPASFTLQYDDTAWIDRSQ